MFRGRNPKEEGHVMPLKSWGEAPPFSIDVKGEINLDHDDRGSMSVSINDIGRYFWKIGFCH
jgi:hypothetical protein